MDNVMESPYAAWLEGLVKEVIEQQPVAIVAAMILPDGSILTICYRCNNQDKAILAANIYADCIMDAVKINAKDILQAAEEQEDLDGEDRPEV